jgi:hypothetical protein
LRESDIDLMIMLGVQKLCAFDVAFCIFLFFATFSEPYGLEPSR